MLTHCPVFDQAHDRFGPDTLSVCAGKCIAYRDYWIRGLQASAGFYVATLVSLLLLTLTKSVEYGTYVSVASMPTTCSEAEETR